MFEGDDPPGLCLRAVVDVEDPDDVVAIYLDRLVTYQADDGLSIYVLTVRPRLQQSSVLENSRHEDSPFDSAHVASDRSRGFRPCLFE